MQEEINPTNKDFSWKKKHHHRPIYRCPGLLLTTYKNTIHLFFI